MVDMPHDLVQLLAAYHRAEEQQARTQMGYPSECPSTRGYRAQGWRNDVLDAEAESSRVNGVRFVIDRLPRVEQCAAGILARNAATGRSVWRSAILPADDGERAALFRRVIGGLCAALSIGVEMAA